MLSWTVTSFWLSVSEEVERVPGGTGFFTAFHSCCRQDKDKEKFEGYLALIDGAAYSRIKLNAFVCSLRTAFYGD